MQAITPADVCVRFCRIFFHAFVAGCSIALAKSSQISAIASWAQRNALASFLRAAPAQLWFQHTYAPRPGAEPDKSTDTDPERFRTIRSNSCLGAFLRHPTHVLSGTCLRLEPPAPLDRTTTQRPPVTTHEALAAVPRRSLSGTSVVCSLTSAAPGCCSAGAS